MLDLYSVAVGASEEPLVRRAAESFLIRGDQGQSHVWGWKDTYSLSTAAMLNGMLAHTLELDDVHSASKTHGSASLIPAAWACTEYLGKSGKEFLTAVVCGYETVSRIGMAFGVAAHRNRGWHATATCGVFGCAAACAKLLGLAEDPILWALGMAGTQSSGVWAFLGDGCNCKVLHTGRAAVNGMDAAFLAQAGMTGPEHILDAEDGGLLTAMSDGGDIRCVSRGLGETWEILNMDRKPYPCCRSTHPVIDCAMILREQVRAEEIESISVDTYLVGYKQCAVSEGCLHPKTVLDAKFSTPYAVAAAFIYGKVTMEEFTEEAVLCPEVQELLEKVRVTAAERFTAAYPGHWGCAMSVVKKDGGVLQAEVKDPSGSIFRPLTPKQVMDKAKGFLSVAYRGREQEIAETILRLPELEKLPRF